MENYDKYSCHEIEALVKSGELDLNTLSDDQLNAFLDYLCENDMYEDECFYKCTDALSSKESVNYAETAINLMHAAINQYDALCDSATKQKEMKVIEERDEKRPARILKKRMAALIIAATLIISLLAMTAYAIFNPFSEFGVAIRELFGFKTGDSIETESEELIVGGDEQKSTSFDELCDRYSTTFYKIGSPFIPADIRSSYKEEYTEIIIEYQTNSNNKSKVFCNIYIEYNNPPLKKEDYTSLEIAKAEIYNSHEFVVLCDEGFYQAMLFEKDRIYIITANSNQELELALKSFDK